MSGQIRYDQRYLSLPEVYRLGSFSAAGERLALTPSAVAQQMHSLERELRVTLFRKGDRRLIPTPECETVMKYIGRMQALGRQLEDELTNTRRGRLRVGITPSAAVSLPGLLTRYEEQQPGVQMTVTTAPAAVLYGMLRSLDIDLALAEGDCPCAGCGSILLDTDHLAVVAPPDSRYAGQGVITLAQLRQEPLILKPPGSGTRRMLEASLRSAGLSLDGFRVRMEVEDAATIKKLVAGHYGLSVLSGKACSREIAAGTLCTVALEGMPMMRDIRLLYRKDARQEELIHGIRQCYAALVREWDAGDNSSENKEEFQKK